LGLALMLYGLMTGGGTAVLGGQIVASLSRQTGLLLVPMAIIWLWRGGGAWASTGRSRRRALSIGVVGVAAAAYLVTAWIASTISGPSDNLAHVTGLAASSATSFDARTLAVFLARMVVAPAIPLLLLAALSRDASPRASAGDVPLLWLGVLCIAAQPLVAGPEITGGNGPRLVALGLVPLCILVAIRIRDTSVFTHASAGRRYWAMGLLMLASMHHVYVLSGSSSARMLFAFAYIAACAGLFVIARVERRHAAVAMP
jgi:hypothetical protein